MLLDFYRRMKGGVRVVIGSIERETKRFGDVPGSWQALVQIKTSREEFRLEATTPFGAALDDVVQSAVETEVQSEHRGRAGPPKPARLVELVDHIGESDDV